MKGNRCCSRIVWMVAALMVTACATDPASEPFSAEWVLANSRAVAVDEGRTRMLIAPPVYFGFGQNVTSAGLEASLENYQRAPYFLVNEAHMRMIFDATTGQEQLVISVVEIRRDAEPFNLGERAGGFRMQPVFTHVEEQRIGPDSDSAGNYERVYKHTMMFEVPEEALQAAAATTAPYRVVVRYPGDFTTIRFRPTYVEGFLAAVDRSRSVRNSREPAVDSSSAP